MRTEHYLFPGAFRFFWLDSFSGLTRWPFASPIALQHWQIRQASHPTPMRFPFFTPNLKSTVPDLKNTVPVSVYPVPFTPSVELGIVKHNDMGPVNSVLNAAALTYVAATLQSILQLLYFVMVFAGGRRERS